jgi:hypothetical protein
MNVSPDQVRAATRSAAAVITPDKVPPLRLGEPARGHGQARRARRAWVTPLAAAAAIVVVAVASATAGSWLARSGPARSAHPAGVTQGASGSSSTVPQQVTGARTFAGVPPYYVAVENQSLAEVRATATGATLAKIATSTPFVAVTGAADDRTFVLDAQRQVMGPTVLWPDQPKFYLLELSASGAEKSFTELALPALPKGIAVTGLALSPDGSKLAVEVDTGGTSNQPLLEIRVYTLATGAYRTWSAPGLTDPGDAGGFTGSGVDGAASISWAAGSRTLAFRWRTQSFTVGVSLLDTAASGDSLLADSRLAVTELDLATRQGTSVGTPPDYVSECVTDSILSLDGSAIVCGYTTTMGPAHPANNQAAVNPANERTATGFVRYSTKTGKPAQVYGVSTFKGQAGGSISLWWTSSTGKTLIGGVPTRTGIRVGVISGQTFTPLPGTGVLGAVAW